VNLVAELPGLWTAHGPGALRFLRDPETGGWIIDMPPIHRVTTNAAQVRAFTLACRECMAAGPGERDADLYDIDRFDQALLGFEIEPDGTVNLQLLLNLAGAVTMEGPDYDRAAVHLMIDALLEATA
jgi:hypothetical protein